jgi:protein phosphatase 1 regulatory subunit 7
MTYAFSKLNLENKNVQDITDCIGDYKHLRDVNLSHNDIKDISEVQRLDFLVNLQASHNKIASIEFFAEASVSL